MMVINGGSRCNGGFFARHLMRTDTNERVSVCELRGLLSENLRDAFREMEAVASGTDCKNYFYHANIDPEPSESRILTPEQWQAAVDRLEKNLGFAGQPRLVVEHEKDGRVHRHVVWSRIDASNMKALSDSLTYGVHEQTSRECEIAFGLRRGQSTLTPNREGPRPERNPKSYEMFRGQDAKMDPRAVQREVTMLWRATDSGLAFVAALHRAGYIVAQGTRRDFVIFDRAAKEHSIAKRITGVTVAVLSERMKDVDRASLPSFDEGKALAKARLEKARDEQRERGDGQGVSGGLQAGATAERKRDGSGQSGEEEERGRGKKSAGRASVATTDGGLVAQQREAMRMLTRKERVARIQEQQRAAAKSRDDTGRKRGR